MLLETSNKDQGLLVYSILNIMVQLHWLNSQLDDQQVAPTTW